MAITRLSLDEFEQEEYHLIAIHSPLEDYRLAYFLNLQLNVNLKKSNTDLKILNKNNEICFSKFCFEEEDLDCFWYLLQNRSSDFIDNSITIDLFSESKPNYSKTEYLVNDYKKVDYFLKINTSSKKNYLQEIISKINLISNISASYEVDLEKSKSKNNLIF